MDNKMADEMEEDFDDENDCDEESSISENFVKTAITGRGVTLQMLIIDGIIEPGNGLLTLKYLSNTSILVFFEEMSVEGNPKTNGIPDIVIDKDESEVCHFVFCQMDALRPFHDESVWKEVRRKKAIRQIQRDKKNGHIHSEQETYQNKESEAETNQILEELIKKNSELSEELEEYKEFEEENTMFDSDGGKHIFCTNKDVDKMLEEQSDTHLKLVSKLEDENRTLKSKMEHLTSVQCANSTIEKQETRLNTETRMSPMDIVDKLIQNQNKKHSTKRSSKNSKRKSRVSKNTS
ncbi:MPND [Mytilus edulis]|uniref:MPND n=1 Tax=Mytilus edulis TaxID=6550 RepID=A0A8S3R2S4_MYTED|nr:MPND [Mytilus edulis]